MHMNAKHHYIREAKQLGVIDVIHVKSALLRPDTKSKIFTTPQFKRGRDKLLNIQASVGS